MKNEIIKYITSELSSYITKGFSEPIVTEDTSMTSVVNLFLKTVSIEFEIDWHDFNVFVLLVKIEEGKLPNGYYVSNGKKCRIHLKDVISRFGWISNASCIISNQPKSQIKNKKRTHNEILEKFNCNKKLLDSVIENIKKNELQIFD